MYSRRLAVPFAVALCATIALAPGRMDAQRDRSSRNSRNSRDDNRGDQQSGEPFKWSGDVASGRWVYLRNLNGTVRVEAGTGRKMEITATKHWRRGNPADVDVTVRQVGSGAGDVLVCAIWRRNDSTRCDEDGYNTHSDNWGQHDRDNNNDVSVEIVVRLPAGVKVDATTVNGDVSVDGATSTVTVHTVNGGVEARSSGGPVRAKTVNGDVTVHTGLVDDSGTEYSTTNGSITVEIPPSTNADLDMRTVNGSVSSDFPLTVQGSFSPRRMRATLGKGGPTIKLSTVNGSIRLRKN